MMPSEIEVGDVIRGTNTWWTIHTITAGGELVIRVQGLDADYYTTISRETWREMLEEASAL